MIKFKNVSYSVDDHQIIAPVNLELHENRIGIVGLNGSGKSTFARLLTGLIPCSNGEILVNDVDIYADRTAALDTVGIIFQNPEQQIIFPTCIEEVSFGLKQKGMKTADAELRALEVFAQYGRMHWKDQLVYNLSQGQKHLLCLISILAMEPNVIVLDEPYAGLDIPTQMQLHRKLTLLEQQIILITHDPNVISDFDRVLWIDDGVIIQDGKPSVVLQSFTNEMKHRGNIDAGT